MDGSAFGYVIGSLVRGFKQLALITLGIVILVAVGAFYLGRKTAKVETQPAAEAPMCHVQP